MNYVDFSVEKHSSSLQIKTSLAVDFNFKKKIIKIMKELYPIILISAIISPLAVIFVPDFILALSFCVMGLVILNVFSTAGCHDGGKRSTEILISLVLLAGIALSFNSVL